MNPSSRAEAARAGSSQTGHEPALARLVVERFGGRFSSELGIDVDRGGEELERWFLAATLFGARISTAIAMRTYRTLTQAGVATIADAEGRSWEELVALLDAGGYVRYDFRTATRLHQLAAAVRTQTNDGVAPLLEPVQTPSELEETLDNLPGWGPTTVRLFLRELRGTCPAAELPVDERALGAAAHLGLIDEQPSDSNAWLRATAVSAGIDPRDLETGLVRLALAHQREFAACPGRAGCTALRERASRTRHAGG